MNKLLTKGGLCLAALALGAAPAPAAMRCWDTSQAAAAKIRDLQSRLMVATMRCRAMGIDVLGAYNDFVRSNRETIQAANGVIKAQFSNGFGEAGQAEYDRFTTLLANAYGAEATSAEECEATATLAGEGTNAKGDIGLLLALAEQAGRGPDLPGGQCPITFAAAPAE